MPRCNICHQPVMIGVTHHSQCWKEEAEKLAEIFCSHYCRWPRECSSKEECQEQHCDKCDMVRVLNLGV